jgi:hypothetical protein
MNLKKETIIILGIFTAIVLILILVLIYPLLKGLREASSNFIEIKKELTLFYDRAGEIESLKLGYEEIERDLEKTEDFFVNSEVPIDLIKFWEETALNSGISINISPLSSGNEEDDQKEEWDSMVFRINSVGPFTDFLRFLERIEIGSYLIEIEDISVRKLTGSDIGFSDYRGFSINDVKTILTIKVFIK